MQPKTTLVFRASLADEKSLYRDIEIPASQSLYRFAEAIVAAFGFDFDHAFGFYSGLTPAQLMRKNPRYELFADMGDAAPGVLGVKKTKISQAFPAVGHAMMFLFDYGDDWLFHVKLTATATQLPKVRYPRVIATAGEAPPQYPDADDIGDDAPTFGIDPTTGKKITFGR
jgi:hypothetical protein